MLTKDPRAPALNQASCVIVEAVREQARSPTEEIPMSAPGMTLFHNPASPLRAQSPACSDRDRPTGPRGPAASYPTITEDADVVQGNPTGKIPALRLADGSVLRRQPGDPRLLRPPACRQPADPRDGSARWRRLTLASMADGIMDAAVLVRYKTAAVRPPEKHWAPWLDEQRNRSARPRRTGADAVAENWPAASTSPPSAWPVPWAISTSPPGSAMAHRQPKARRLVRRGQPAAFGCSRLNRLCRSALARENRQR